MVFISLLAVGWFGIIRFNRYLGGFLGQIDPTTGALLHLVYVYLCLNVVLFKFSHSRQQKILVTILFVVAFLILMLLDYWEQMTQQDNQ
jgi:ABC-type proline/glycine betaine transport system permease subunit